MMFLLLTPVCILILLFWAIIVHYGISSRRDLTRELKIIRVTFTYVWTQFMTKTTNTNYVKVWRNSVKKFGQEPFIVDRSKTYTFEEVDKLSNTVGKFLYEKGIVEKSTVAIIMGNGVEFVVCWLATVKLGAKAALVNTNLCGDSLAHCIRLLDKCNIVLIDRMVKCQIAMELPIDAFQWIPVYTVDLWSKERETDLLSEYIMNLIELIPDSENTAKWAGEKQAYDATIGYLFTSGTTGYPKAVPMSFNKIWSVVKVFFINRYSITKEDRIYSVLPLYHSTAFCIGLHISVMSGCAFIVREKLSVQHFWNDIYQHDATIFLYVGEMCRFLLNSRSVYIPKLQYKTRLCLGNGLSKDIYTEFKTAFNIPVIAEFYGQTEGFAFLGSVLQVPGSLGYIPKLKTSRYPYRVIKCNTETLEPMRQQKTGLCELCEVNEPGLLIANSTNMDKKSVYHHGNHDARYICNVERRGDLFLSTGDLMKIGPDRSYYFVDRLGDTFRWKGENVSTQEVEGVLCRAPGVKQVVVYGVTIPGHSGRGGMAALVTNLEKLSFSEIYELCAKNLPKYAIPLFIRTVNSLETTPTFKLKRSQLQIEGFDTRVSENMYRVDRVKKSYVRITKDFATDLKMNGDQIKL